MKKHLPNSTYTLGLVVGLLVTASTGNTWAATATWTGGSASSGNWSDASNWLGGTVPASGDSLVFADSTLRPDTTNDLSAFSAGPVTLGAGNFNFYGNSLTLNGVANQVGANSFYLPLVLGASQNFEIATSYSLTVANTLDLGANVLTFTGDGDSTLAGVVSGTAGYVTKTGGGTMNITAKPTFSGPFQVNGGLVVLNTPTYERALVNSTNVIVNAGAALRLNVVNILYQSGIYTPITVNGGTVELNGYHNHFGPLTLNGGTVNGISTSRYNNEYSTFDFDVTVGGSAQSIITGMDTAAPYALVAANRKFTVAATGDPYGTDLRVDNPLSGGGLIKDGPGKMSLGGVNTYSGPTVINGGTLILTGAGTLATTPTISIATGAAFDVATASLYSIATNQTVNGTGSVIGTVYDYNAGATLAPGNIGSAGTLAMEGLTLNGNLALKFDLANTTTAGGGVNDLLIVTNLTLASGVTNTVDFSFLNISPQAGGTYTLIQYTTGPAAGPVTTLAATASRYSYAFTSDGSSIKVTVTGTPASLVWKGDDINNYWDIVTTPNWLRGSTPDVFYSADNVLFNDSGSATPSINLISPLSPTTVTVDATKDYAFAGAGKISGSASLIKSNSGSLLLLNDNDQTGPTRIEGGTVYVGNGSTTGSPGAGSITNNGTLVFNRSDSPTLPGAISGAGQLTKLGGGTLTTLSAHPFTGTLTISNGAVQLGNVSAGTAGFEGSVVTYGTFGIRGMNDVALRGPISGPGGIQLFGTNTVRLNSVNLTGTGGLSVGNNNGTAGRPTLVVGDGDTVTVGRLFVGETASYNGNVTQTGGLLSVTDVTDGEGPMRLGHWSTETSTYNMSGGLLVITGVPNARLSLGIDGTGVWNMSGGLATINRLDVNGRSTTGGGILNLTNGTIMLGAGGINGYSSYTVNLAGGTLGALANWTDALNNTLNGAVTFDTGPYMITLSGVCSGAGSITKQGAGILALNGASTSTGPLSVQGGTLQGGGTFAGPITVGTGATLSAGGTLATGTLTVSNATLSAGANLVLDLSSTAATSDMLAAKGTLTFDAATPVTFNFLGGAPFAGSPYTIVTNWLPRSGSLTYVNPTRYAVNLDQTHPNRVQVTFSGANADLVWKGSVNNLWNLNADANWLSGGVASTYFQADSVVFDDTGLTAPIVSLAGDMNPAKVTVSSSGDYTLAGGAVGTVGNLVKSGSGKLTLANNNTFGTTVLNAGVLQVGDGATSGSIAGNIVDYASLVFNRSDTVIFPGVITGPGTLTQAGTGTLLVTGNSTFYGGTTVNAGGTVQVGNGVAQDSGLLGNGPVNNLGTINYFRSGSPNLLAPHTGPGALNLIGVGLIGQSSYQMSGTNTFTGPVTVSNARFWSPIGALGFGNPSSVTIQQGSGVFANAVAYSSLVNIPLTLSGSGWLENAGLLGALRLQNGINWAGPITLAGNTRISAHDNALSNVISGTITGPYEAEFGFNNASGFVSLAPSAANSFSALRVSPGTLWLDNPNALPANIPLTMNGGTLKLNGNSLTVTDLAPPASGSIQNGSTTTPVTLTVDLDTDAIYTGTFADGATQPLALVKNGKATLALTGLSTSLGGVTVNGGVLALRNGGGNGTIRGTVTMQPGTLLLSQNNDSFGYNAGATQVTNLNLNAASLIHTPGNNLTLWQNLVVNMTGAYMAATNSGGRLDFGTGASLNTLPSPNPSVIAGANLYMRQGNTIINVADGAAADDLLVTAPINQSSTGYGITKNGAGQMKVMNRYGLTGALTINGGALVLGAPESTLTNTGNITLAAGTTLDAAIPGGLTMAANQVLQGGGTFKGNVTDSTGTVIQPGSPTGTLTIVGSLTLNGAGSLNFDLSNSTTSGNDLIQVNGDVTLNDLAPTVVNFTFLNGAPASGSYPLIKYTGNLIGSVAGLSNKSGNLATFGVDPVNKTINVTFTVPAANLVWQGDGIANSWDYELTSKSWFDGTTDTNFNQLDAVRFDDSRTIVNTTINVIGSVAPSSITFDSTNNYSFTGAGKITGVGTITKNNTGTTTLGVVNDLIGPVNVNAGTLALSVNDSYIGATTITVANGAAFNFGGMNDNVIGRAHDFVIAGVGPDGQGALRNELYDIYEYANVSNLILTADSAIGSTTGARWDIGPAVNSKLDGQGHNLTKVGDGEINLRAQVVTNVNSITVSNGTLFYENYDQTNVWTATTTNFVKPGATLSTYGARTINMPVVLDGAIIRSRNSTPNWTGPFRIEAGSAFYNNLAQNFYGPISGPGAMWVDGGTAALTFTNANTYAGGTVISNAPTTAATANAASGTAAVIMTDPAALGTGPIALNGLSYPSLATNTSFFNTNVLRAVEFAFAAPSTVANNIVLPSATVANVSLHGRDNTRVVNLTGTISGGFAGLTNWIDFGNSGTTGVIRYGNNANTFTGTVSAFRGQLAITGDGSLGNSANLLRLNSGGLRFDAPDINVAHNILLTAGSTFYLLGDNNGDGTLDTVNNATISGIVSGASAITVRGTNGILTLTGNNTFSSGFELLEPVVLQFGASANLGTAYVALKAGSTLRYTGTGNETMTRTMWNDNATLGGGTIDIVNANASLTWNPGAGTCNQNLTKTGLGTLTYGGVISGNAVVAVNGGTLALTAANTYLGPTLVNSGTLLVNGSLPAANAVVVASGATLGGSGVINCPVTLQTGAALQPGVNGIGTLTVNNPLSLSAGTVTTMEINGTTGSGDAILGPSTLTYGGTLVVNNLGAEPAAGTKFTLFSAADRLGSFTSVTLPPLTAPLTWTNMLAIDGSIAVVSGVNTTPAPITWNITGGSLNLSWPADHMGWRLEAQTNSMNIGISNNWVEVPGSTTINSISIPIDPAAPTVFYRLTYP